MTIGSPVGVVHTWRLDRANKAGMTAYLDTLNGS